MRILLASVGAIAVLAGIALIGLSVYFDTPIPEAINVLAVSFGVGLGVPLVMLLVNATIWLVPLLLLLGLILLASRLNRHA